VYLGRCRNPTDVLRINQRNYTDVTTRIRTAEKSVPARASGKIPPRLGRICGTHDLAFWREQGAAEADSRRSRPHQAVGATLRCHLARDRMIATRPRRHAVGVETFI
jgi:hypothetical protein